MSMAEPPVRTSRSKRRARTCPPCCGLAGEILRKPALPESEFEQIRKRALTQLDFGKTEPQSLAFTEISARCIPIPRATSAATLSIPEEIEEVKAAKLDDAKAFYKKFYGASDGYLAVVGDFDPAEVKKEIAEQFGAWKSPPGLSGSNRALSVSRR